MNLNIFPSWRGGSEDLQSEFSFEVDTASPEELTRPVTNHVRQERLRQARMTFNAALILGVIGVSILLGGFGLLLYIALYKGGSVATGAITVAAGLVSTTLSRVLLRLSSEANDRLDKNDSDLSALETARMFIQLIGNIQDPGKRDDAIVKVAESLRLEIPSGRVKVQQKPQPRVK